MGDMADWIIDQGMDELLFGDQREGEVSCKFCNCRSLSWTCTKVGWRLRDESGVTR